VTSYLNKNQTLSEHQEHQGSFLEKYSDKFFHHLEKELQNLDELFEAGIAEHSKFMESRERISILIKTMTELHVLEQGASATYMGSGQIFSQQKHS